jgi:hypothetical protein
LFGGLLSGCASLSENSAKKQAQSDRHVKYWEIIADKLSAAGWSWGYCSAVIYDCWRWIVDAHREGRRCIVHSDELLTAFLELERVTRENLSAAA